MTQRPSLRELTAWRVFLQAHAAVIRVLERELLTETGMPLSWYDVLVQLRQAPEGRLRMRALADATLLSRSGLTRLVDRLEREALVRRERCATDARGWFVVLTPAGQDQFTRAAPVHLRGIATHFTDLLTPEQAETLRAVLSTVARAALDDLRATADRWSTSGASSSPGNDKQRGHPGLMKRKRPDPYRPLRSVSASSLAIYDRCVTALPLEPSW